jgi:hypothetical protein
VIIVTAMFRTSLAAVMLLAAVPVAAQQPSPPAGAVPPADQSAIVPGDPNRPNKTVEIRPGPAPIGPESSVTGEVVSWEEGRNVTVRFGDGSQVTYPVASNIIFPPDIRGGGRITVTTAPIEGGGVKVIGLTTVMPPPPPADTIPIEPAATPTVSGPKNTAQKPGPRKPTTTAPAAIGAATRLATQSASTVSAYEKGKSLTITRSDGSTWTYRLAKNAEIPEDLAVGKQVSIETKIANKKRYVTRISYKTSGVVITNTK